MINIKHLEKYYYKDLTNEIHVINDVSLELPDTGFVSILGPSGSGKTSLLNVIGGLDSFYSGTIEYNGLSFNSYKPSKIDDFRKDHIGYVFQNYLLDENDTVYNNLKNALEISSILDSKEQYKRIDYALKAVGLEKYKKKLAKNLSGGQMQRVAIARVLVKNVDIILADEPTGNIDSENTVWILNILKKISKHKLVLLVTHETEMAKYYSDRIIEIKDGKITDDYQNESSKALNIQSDRTIHLQDYKLQQNVTGNIIEKIYTDDESTDIKLDIVVKNNTIYIKANKRVVDITESSIVMVDDKYHDLEKDDKVETSNFDTSWYDNSKVKVGFFKRLFSYLKNSFYEFTHTKNINKVFTTIFAILGCVMGGTVISYIDFSTPELSNCINSEDYYVIYNDDSEINYQYPVNDSSIYYSLLSNNKVNGISLISSGSLIASYKKNFVEQVDVSLTSYIKLYDDSLNIIYGTSPSIDTCVISKKLADKFLAKLGLEVTSDNYKKLAIEFSYDCEVVGIVDDNEEYIYLSPLAFYNDGYYYTAYVNSGNTKYLTGEYTIVSGRNCTNDYEIILSKEFVDSYDELNTTNVLNRTISYKRDSNSLEKEYTVVGVYTKSESMLKLDMIYSGPNLNNPYLSYYNGNFEMYTGNMGYSYFVNYADMSNFYKIKEGVVPTNNTSCLASIYSGYNVGDVTSEGLTITGLYLFNQSANYLNSTDSYDNLLLTTFDYFLDHTYSGIIIYPNSDTKDYLEENGYTIETLRDYQIRQTTEYQQSINITTLVSIIVLIITFILYSYFSNRSKMINDIYEIGMNRAIGKSKKNILLSYVSYNIIQTTFSCFVGYIIVYIGYTILQYKFSSIFGEHTSHPLLIIIGVVLMYIINILSGILPVWILLRKTPSKIISKYDI